MKILKLMAGFGISAAVLEAATFIVTPQATDLPSTEYLESYAFSATSESMIAAIRAKIADGARVWPTVRIAAGGDGVNRNYLAPGAPTWSWHVAEVVALDTQAPPDVQIPGTPVNPRRDYALRTIDEGFIANYGDGISPRYLSRIFEVNPDQPGSVVNVSNRGRLGAGDAVLIAGFVVQGTTPRVVLARALGPALAQYGVTGVATNPLLKLYRGSALVAQNDNWLSGPSYNIPEWLRPAYTTESAVVVVLAPGVYTVHGSSPDQGIGLLEVYDLSGLR